MNRKTHPQARLTGSDGKWWLVHVPIGVRPPHIIWLLGRVFPWQSGADEAGPLRYHEISGVTLDAGSIIEEGRP
jgi:hypothetical protein